MTRLFHLSTENGRSQTVRDGHQSAYPRANILSTALTFAYSIDGKYNEFP